MHSQSHISSDRTLVINLTRLGDQLQSQPIFSSLKGQGGQTGLVCLQNFQGAAGLMRDVDAVFGVPGARILADMDAAWPKALGGFLDWAGQVVREFAPTRVINLTPSLTGRLLARALHSGAPLGFGMDEFGFGTSSTPWAAFLEASSTHRGASPFNLVDLFWKTAHQPDSERTFRLARPRPGDLQAALSLLESNGTGGHSGYLGLQLGASAAKRQWPVEHFAALGQGLWRTRRLLPVLLGGPGEEDLARRYKAASQAPCVDLTGRTTLGQLAAAVSSLDMLVTNDTGTMHLAAGLGTPILALFLATAQPVDTGPYLEGVCCLEPDMSCHPCGCSHTCTIGEACRNHIAPEVALALAQGFLQTGGWPEVHGMGVRAWQTVRQHDHFMGLRSLSGHDGEDRTVWNRLQRLVWRRFLDGLPLDAAAGEGFVLSEAFRADILAVLDPAVGLLGVLAQQAQVVRLTGNKAMRTKFMATWQRLAGLFSSIPALSALSHLWLHLSHVQGERLDSFQEFAARIENLLLVLSSLLRDRG